VAPGFLTGSRPDGDRARIVTFGNGVVAREVIVTVDDAARRVVWSAAGGRLTHHNASIQVQADGPDRSRLVWLADLLPDERAGDVGGMIDAAIAAMTRTLESAHVAG
jgi:hypothetical protein